MKKAAIALLIIVVAAVATTGCKKVIKSIFPGFEASVPEIKFPLPAVPIVLTEEIAFPTFTQHFDLDSTIKANTGGVFGAGDVSSLKVRSIAFKIINPDQANNLSNFESTRFNFSSNVKSDPVEIASITFPDTYADSVYYTPTNPAELKDYVKGSELYYQVFARSRRITTKKLNLSVKVTLTVK